MPDTLRAPRRSTRMLNDRWYAVAIQDGNDLGLTFWIKRSAKGEIVLFYPGDSEMDPHASYHRDGTYHQKTYGRATGATKLQSLNDFRGAEHLGKFSGHGAGPPILGASQFDDVIVAPPGVLSGTKGAVMVDLVEPGQKPTQHHRERVRIVCGQTYKDAIPWIVVAIAAD